VKRRDAVQTQNHRERLIEQQVAESIARAHRCGVQ
jgi:hypothetical protein